MQENRETLTDTFLLSSPLNHNVVGVVDFVFAQIMWSPKNNSQPYDNPNVKLVSATCPVKQFSPYTSQLQQLNYFLKKN